MKTRAWRGLMGLALVVGVWAAAIAIVVESRNPAGSAAPSGDHERAIRGLRGPAEPDDYFIQQRSGGPTRGLDQKAFARAARQAQAIRAASDSAAAPRQLRNPWELVGPVNIGGRIVDVAVDPTATAPSGFATLYVAAATGGLWKSDDGIVDMVKVWPDTLPQSMGAVAVGSNGRIWAGTGEHNPGGGSITFGGAGIYISDDGGATWKKRGLDDSGTTGRIAIDPTNPDTVFVAASGSLFNPGGERGIYRSTNGGASWQLVLAPGTPFTGGIDLAIHPTNPKRIYAAMWDHRREPDKRTYGGVGSGLFRSDDGGDTWVRLENVLTSSPGDATGLAVSDTLGRIGMALAPSNPDRVYVITTHTFGADKGFYVSNDGGDSFQAVTRPGSQGGFGWWFGRLWVDPVNPDHVFAAGVNLRRSTNGGLTWSNVGGVHADQHGMAWDPFVPGRVYLGNDGGTYRSDTNGVSGSFRQAVYEPYTQHYSIDVSQTNPERQTGGTQDNGCIRSWSPTTPSPGPDTWSSYGCGDGEYTVIDPGNANIYYGCSQYGACFRRNDDLIGMPGFNRNIQPPGSLFPARRNWYTPIVLDPNDPATIYYGGNWILKSTNRGDSWVRISPPEVDLTGTFESPDRVDPAYPNWGTITTIAIAKTAPDTIYLGTDTGRLWKTEDGGATWVEFVGKGLPKRWVTRVAIDPTDARTVYAVFSGFRAGEAAANVFKTADGGATWANISGNLPNAPVNDVVVDVARSTVYVGTDVGVYYLKNDKKNWHPVGRGLPLVPVLDIKLHEPTATLYASTFGRSSWKTSVD